MAYGRNGCATGLTTMVVLVALLMALLVVGVMALVRILETIQA